MRIRTRVSRPLGAVMAAAALGLSACATQTDSTTHRGVGEYTEDAALTAQVKSAIASDAGLRAATARGVKTPGGADLGSGLLCHGGDAPGRHHRRRLGPATPRLGLAVRAGAAAH